MENAVTNFGPMIALSGAALAAILGGIGSAIGIGTAGATGAGVTSEKPDLFGNVIVLEALPGSQAIYGLVGAFLVIFFVGFADLTVVQGWQVFMACMPLAITALFSAIYQGRTVSAAMNILAKHPTEGGKAIILSAVVETVAIFGFLVTFLALNYIKQHLGA